MKLVIQVNEELWIAVLAVAQKDPELQTSGEVLEHVLKDWLGHPDQEEAFGDYVQEQSRQYAQALEDRLLNP